jgi:hypothetical protein
MDSRNLDPAVFSHRFFTRAIPIAATLSALFWVLLALGFIAACLRFA